MIEHAWIWAALIGFGVTAAICPWGIPFLHKLKFGQQVRDDGPQSHLKKQGTPTMGGIMILAGFALSSLCFTGRYPDIWPVLLLTLGFGLVGFTDDFLKIVKKQSEGLDPRQKLLMQVIFTGIFVIYMLITSVGGMAVRIPFWNRLVIIPVWLYVPAMFFVILGTDNGTNFTDGLDGLLSSVTIPVALFIAAVSTNEGWGIAPAAGAMAGALMGFLLYNAYPAKVFMGDTGSLAIGGFVAASMTMMQRPVYIAVIGIIYLIEVVSVIIQVLYFKKTKGRRFFRMAPIHHHFELGGWSETRVVTVFTAVTAAACMIGYLM